MSRFLKLVATCMIGVLTLGACSNVNSEDSDEITKIRIATLIEDASPELGLVFEDFRADLEEHLGIPVSMIEGATHLVGIEAMRSGNLELMWGSPFVYLQSQQIMEVERLAVTNNPASINKTVFITSRDDIQSMDDIQGKSLAFISSASTSGFVYPMYHLMNLLNMNMDEVMTGGYFSAVTYSGSQNASIMGVVHGDFDVAAVGNLNLQSMIRSGVVNADDVRILGDTEIIPFPGYIASASLPVELRDTIRDFLLAYDNEDYFGERFGTSDTRFVRPDEASIQHLLKIVEALELDLNEQS